MRKKIFYKSIFIMCILGFSWIAYSAQCPLKGDSFPDIFLASPQSPNEKNYLGLKNSVPFKITGIRAEVVILEIFSMYCPYCQREAPLVNELYDIISKRDDIKDKIKIFGVGAGNTPFEVDVFRKKYNIRFPLLSDESYAVHKAVGEVGTPYFFVMKIKPDGSNSIIYSKVGSIQDANLFLYLIMKEAGL